MSGNAASPDENHQRNKKKHLIIGVSLVLLCNAIYLGNNYLLKFCDVRATELASVSGIVQMLLFGFLRYKERRRGNDQNEKIDCKTFVYLACYGTLMSMMAIVCLVAIPMMPVGDLVVLCFTGPAFTVFLAFFVLKQELTVLKVILSFSIIGGDILVVQPPFIFGQGLHNGLSLPSYDESAHQMYLERSSTLTGHDTKYYIGVALCMCTAVIGSVARIFNTKLVSNGVGNNTLMISAGVARFILSFTIISIIPNRILNGEGLPTEAYYILPLAVFNSLAAFWCMTVGLDYLRDPTLVVMLRSTEILYSLVSESLINMRPPEAISLIGTMIVLVCVCSMALHDVVQQIVMKTFKGIKYLGKKFVEAHQGGSLHGGQGGRPHGGQGAQQEEGEDTVMITRTSDVDTIKEALKLSSTFICR